MTTVAIDIASHPTLPSLEELKNEIDQLVAKEDQDQLDEIRRQAEAHRLYAYHSKITEREDFFSRLRMLAEAALGILSFDQKLDLNQPHSQLAEWRVLGAAYERGVFDVALKEQNSVFWIKRNGYTRAKVGSMSLPWAKARTYFKRCDFKSIPPDMEYVKRQITASKRRAEEARRAREALERLDYDRMARRSVNKPLSKSYSLTRQLAQTLSQALGEESTQGTVRKALLEAQSQLYYVEDAIQEALREGRDYNRRVKRNGKV